MKEQDYQFYKTPAKCLDCGNEFFVTYPYEFEDIQELTCTKCNQISYIDMYKEEGLGGFDTWYKNKYGTIKDDFDKEYNRVFYNLINKCPKCGDRLVFGIRFKCPKCYSKNVKEDTVSSGIITLKHSEIDWVKYSLPEEEK